MTRALLAALCCLATLAQAAEPARFLSRDALPNGETVVVAEGDLEAPFAGSYTVRLYAADSQEQAMRFTDGLILPREGRIEQVMVMDVDADETDEVIVVFRSGTPVSRAAQVFDVDHDQVTPLVAVTGLAADADLLSALREKATVREGVRQRQADRLKR